MRGFRMIGLILFDKLYALFLYKTLNNGVRILNKRKYFKAKMIQIKTPNILYQEVAILGE